MNLLLPVRLCLRVCLSSSYICNAPLDMNSIWPETSFPTSILKGSFPVYRYLVCQLLIFRTWSRSSQDLLAFKISNESTDITMSLYSLVGLCIFDTLTILYYQVSSPILSIWSSKQLLFWMSVPFSRLENWEVSQLFLSPLGFLIVSPSPWTLWFCFFVCLVCFLMLYFINHVLHCKYTFICLVILLEVLSTLFYLKKWLTDFLSNTFYSLVALLNASCTLLSSLPHCSSSYLVLLAFPYLSTFPLRSRAKVICLCFSFSFSSHQLILAENFWNLPLALCNPWCLWVH